ncbi:MAG: hypothetical protein LUE21_09220 [Oscillospiraceae bacterium]|nr:hypothetical protein [Oscillospiraceae bacterium]
MGIAIALILVLAFGFIKVTDGVRSQAARITTDEHIQSMRSDREKLMEYTEPLHDMDVYKNYGNTDEWEEVRRRIKVESGVPFVSLDMISLGVLAQRGRTTAYRIEEGGVLSSFKNASDAAILRMFMVWLDRELVSHGFPEHMVFVKRGDQHGFNISEPQPIYLHEASSDYCTRVDDPALPLVDGWYTWVSARGGLNITGFPHTILTNDHGNWSDAHPGDRYDDIWFANIKEEE